MYSYNEEGLILQLVSPVISTEKARVLVVEDQPISQAVAKRVLENKGYQVDIAPTGQEALQCYHDHSYAIILMDVGLPDITGTEVAGRIRALEQQNGKHTPIIALTTNDPSTKPECLAAGMDDFSPKPFEVDALLQMMHRWMTRN